MGRPDYIFGQFGETARCRDAQHGGGVCCALTPQLVFIIIIIIGPGNGSPVATNIVAFDLVVVVLILVVIRFFIPKLPWRILDLGPN